MELYIETLTGTGYELRVSPFEPIISVKAKIQRLGGIPVSQQHLIWQSVELEDDYNLDDYKIHDGATLKLVLAMRGGPINTRRIPMEDPSFREMAEYVEANKEEFGGNRQVTLLVFREGDQLNFFRVVDRGDGTLTPLSESLSGTSVYNLNEEDEEEEEDVLAREKVDENNKLKEKVQELRLRMEHLNLNKKPVSQQPPLHLPQPPSVGVPSSRPIRRQQVSSSGTSLLNRNPLLPPVGQTFSNSNTNVGQISELLPCLSLPASRKSLVAGSVPVPKNELGKTLVSEECDNKDKASPDQKEARQFLPSENVLQSGIKYKILSRLKTDQPSNVTKDDTSYCGSRLVKSFESLDRKVSSATAVSNERLNEFMDNVELTSAGKNHLPNYLKPETLGHVSCDTVSHSVKSPQKSTQTFSSAVASSTEGGADTLSVRDYSNHKLVTKKVPPDPCGLVSSKLKKRQDQFIHNLRDALCDPTTGQGRVSSSKEMPRSPETVRRPPTTSSHCDWKKDFALESLSSSEAYAVTGMLRQASLERIGSSHIGNFIHSSTKSKFSAGNLNNNFEGPVSNPDRRIVSSHIHRITSGHDSHSNLTSPANVHHRLPPVKPKKQPAKRCLTCSKKTGIASSYTCRCGSNFCALHRYAESHNCTFDYKTEGRKLLEKTNPVITAPKLPKI